MYVKILDTWQNDVNIKKKSKNQVNMTEENLVAMVTEVNIVENEEWWIDTRVTHYISNDRTTF